MLTRVHLASLAGELFGAGDAGGMRVRDALAAIAQEGEGVLVYIEGEDDTNLQPRALGDREAEIAGQILADLGVVSARLITDEANDVGLLERAGMPVGGRMPVLPPASALAGRPDWDRELSGLLSARRLDAQRRFQLMPARTRVTSRGRPRTSPCR